MVERATGRVPSWRRLLPLARPYRRELAGLFALGLLSAAVVLATPWPLKLAVDHVLGDRPPTGLLEPLLARSGDPGRTGALLACAALVLALGILAHAVAHVSGVLRASTSGRLTLDLRRRLALHVQRLSLRYHDARGSAESTYRVLYDTEAVPAALVDGLLPLAGAGITVIGMLAVLALVSGPIAMLALLVALLVIVVSLPFLRRLRAEWERGKELAGRAQATLQETLGALRVVVAFGREGCERDRLLALAEDGHRTSVRIARTNGAFDLAVGAVVALGLAAALFLGGRAVQAGAMTLGDLLVALGYLGLFYGPLQTALSKAADVQAALVSVARVLALIDEPPSVRERSGARALGRAAGAVELERVSFSYGAGRLVLRDVSLSLPAGSCLGLTGETGAGKTSLLQLLLRLYDPVEGRILVDGTDLRDLTLQSLRENLAVVPQEAVLFNASIAENVACGAPGADAARIRCALLDAGLGAFVASLPAGADTLVGERGMQVSGGERQRIALARAFLRDAPLLLLDEPTSSLDPQTEAALLAALRRLLRGRTAIVVTHRAPVLALCDLHARLAGGRITSLERGSRRPPSEVPA